jgi:anti-anti-sigma factor
VSGELDVSTAPALEHAVARALDGQGGEFHLDVRRMTFMDSTGAQALVRLHQRLTGLGRRLVVVAPMRQVRLVLEILGLDQLIDLRQGTSFMSIAPDGPLTNGSARGVARLSGRLRSRGALLRSSAQRVSAKVTGGRNRKGGWKDATDEDKGRGETWFRGRPKRTPDGNSLGRQFGAQRERESYERTARHSQSSERITE